MMHPKRSVSDQRAKIVRQFFDSLCISIAWFIHWSVRIKWILQGKCISKRECVMYLWAVHLLDSINCNDSMKECCQLASSTMQGLSVIFRGKYLWASSNWLNSCHHRHWGFNVYGWDTKTQYLSCLLRLVIVCSYLLPFHLFLSSRSFS